jgi:DNA-binding NarL/FixJ family response regulator
MNEQNSSPHKWRIFIVDDHPVLRIGLTARITQEKDLVVCGEATDGPKALSAIPKAGPDLVVVDLSLRNGSGMELIKDLVIQVPELKIVVLSMHDEMIYAERAIKAGARAYVMKQDSSQQIVTAVRRVLEGKVFISEKVMAAIASKLGKKMDDSSPLERMNDRELQVFELIGQGLSSTEIAERLHWSIKTVQMYLTRAKAKFGVSSGKELLLESFRWQDAARP